MLKYAMYYPKVNLKTFEQNKKVAIKGGNFTSETKRRYEKEIGQVISSSNFSDKNLLDE